MKSRHHCRYCPREFTTGPAFRAHLCVPVNGAVMAYTIIYRPKPPNYYAGKSAEGLDAWSEDRNFAYKIRTFWEELDLLAKLRADGSPLAVPISCND